MGAFYASAFWLMAAMCFVLIVGALVCVRSARRNYARARKAEYEARRLRTELEIALSAPFAWPGDQSAAPPVLHVLEGDSA